MKALILAAALAGAAPAQKIHELCAPCHSEQARDFATHTHFSKNIGCDACHGPSEAHRKATGAAPPDRVAAPDEVPALCGACHVAQRKDYQASRHAALLAARPRVRSAQCGACHGVHAPRRGAAMERQCLRCHEALPAACRKTGCADCHNKHTLAARR